MAKATPPSSEEAPPRRRQAAERPPGTGKPPPIGEVKTEILDQSLLPDDDDEETLDNPVVEAPPKRVAPPKPAAPLKPEAPPKPATAKVEVLPPREAPRQAPPRARPEDVQKAENLLESFLAAHQRAKDVPQPRQEPPPGPPKAGRTLTPLAVEGRPAAPGQGGALYALNQAQPPGVFFKEHSPGQEEEEEDPLLAAAVDDAIGVLFGVRGIHHIGPGHNETGEPVVVIAAGQDFGEASLREIPPSVGNFKTLLALPFDLLPLRRNR